MNQEMKKTILLVDYENIQNLDLSIIQEQDIDIKIFVGQAQNKIPIELAKSTQQLGQRVEWIQINQKLSEQEIETLVDTLFVQKKIFEVSDRLTYNF